MSYFMQLEFTRISSKGQIVLPQNMRKGFRQGEKLLIIKKDNRIILKRADDLRAGLEEDILFAKQTEDAWKKYDEGKFLSVSKEEFLQDLDKW